MDIVKNIDELLSIIDNNFDDFKSVLDQVVAEIVKNPQHINTFITYINVQLSNSKTRRKGILLLDIYLTVGPADNITENAVAWLNNCLKYPLQENKIDDATFRVLKPLLESCHGIPELTKAVTSGVLSKVIEHITKNSYKSTNCIHALKCLEMCIRVYPGPCTAFKNNLEKYLISFVDSNSKTIVRASGKCLHALQQVGQGGVHGTLHKQAWKKQQLNICSTIHSLMDQMFESITEFGNFQQENSEILQLPDLLQGDETQLKANRINNLVIFLQEMLLSAFPTSKSVMPTCILDVVSRGLSVTGSTIGNQICNEALNLGSQLYFIHTHLLELLQSLIICLGCNLIPFSTIIVKLLVNTLNCTSPKTANNINTFCELRLKTYQTLSVWMNTSKSASCLPIFADKLIPIIITDITPIKHELNLTIKGNIPKHLSKKARKKMQQDQITESSMATTYSPITKKTIESTNQFQVKICSEALRLLQCMLMNTGCLLKPSVHKQLQEFTVKTLFEIQRGLTQNPYETTECKIELYKTLSSLVTNHHWNITPPLQYTILLLSKGQVDNDPRISTVCSAALSNLNSFIHPAFATLQLPLDLESLKEELNLENGKSNTVLLFNNDTMHSDNEIELFDNSIKESPIAENDKMIEENLPNVEASTSKDSEINDVIAFKAVEKEIEKIEENAKKQKEKIKNALVEVFENIKESEPQLTESETPKPEDVIEISGGATPPNEIKTSNSNQSSPNKSYSVQIEILSDDEVMERLTIDDEFEPNHRVENGTKRVAEPDINEEQLKKKQCTDDKEKVAIIDLVEEDLCSSFVDIVNQ